MIKQFLLTPLFDQSIPYSTPTPPMLTTMSPATYSTPQPSYSNTSPTPHSNPSAIPQSTASRVDPYSRPNYPASPAGDSKGYFPATPAPRRDYSPTPAPRRDNSPTPAYYPQQGGPQPKEGSHCLLMFFYISKIMKLDKFCYVYLSI